MMNNPIDIFTSDVYGTFLCVTFCIFDGLILYYLYDLRQKSKLMTTEIKDGFYAVIQTIGEGFEYVAQTIRDESDKY